MLHQAGSQEWVSPDLDLTWRWVEDSFQDKWGVVWVDGDAPRIVQCSKHFYEAYKSGIKTIYREVFGSLFWRYPD